MAYQKNQNLLGQEFIEIEFVLESPKVEEKQKVEKYVLSAPLSKKEFRADRKSRRNSHMKFIRPVSNFSVAAGRISY